MPAYEAEKKHHIFFIQHWLSTSVIIIIFVGVGIIAYNPSGRAQTKRDDIRSSDVAAITAALSAYGQDHGGKMPPVIEQLSPGAVGMIVTGAKAHGCQNNNQYCSSQVTSDDNCVNLAVLEQEGYLSKIPVSVSSTKQITWDQGNSDEQRGTGYTIKKEGVSIIISACEAEQRQEIKKVIK